MIGVAAYSPASTLNLLQEVEKMQGDNELTIICVGKPPKESDKKSKIKYTSDIQNFNVTECKRVLVVGAEFSNWEYVKKRKNSLNCRMMIIDDGSKMHVPDALLPLACLSSTHCKLIVAGDINVSALKPHYTYSFFTNIRHRAKNPFHMVIIKQLRLATAHFYMVLFSSV